MTNYEYLKTATKEEISHFLCGMFDECEHCPVRDHCFYGYTGFKAWLDKEVDKE